MSYGFIETKSRLGLGLINYFNRQIKVQLISCKTNMHLMMHLMISSIRFNHIIKGLGDLSVDYYTKNKQSWQ